VTRSTSVGLSLIQTVQRNRKAVQGFVSPTPTSKERVPSNILEVRSDRFADWVQEKNADGCARSWKEF